MKDVLLAEVYRAEIFKESQIKRYTMIPFSQPSTGRTEMIENPARSQYPPIIWPTHLTLLEVIF